MAQWEICRVALVHWHAKNPSTLTAQAKYSDAGFVLSYFTPTGVINKFLSPNSWEQAFAILAAAEWEAITIQYGLLNPGSDTGWAGSVRGMYVDHPSGNKEWLYDKCSMVAYFKRPIQAGRKIDDAL